MGIKDQDKWGNIGLPQSGGKEQFRTRMGLDKAEITWSDCKISSKLKVAVKTFATEGEIVVRSWEGKVRTLELWRLGNTIRFQRGQVGVLKSQEIAKIVRRWRGWRMMMQLVIREDRRWVSVRVQKLPVGGEECQATPPELPMCTQDSLSPTSPTSYSW